MKKEEWNFNIELLRRLRSIDQKLDKLMKLIMVEDFKNKLQTILLEEIK